jgi:hypothetical protein
LTRRGTVRRLCPHPLLHYCQYVPLDCASGFVSITRGGERRAGQSCRAHLSMTIAKLRRLFKFHLLFYYMAEAPSSTFNPHRLLQLQSSSPLHPSSTSILLANFIPCRCQLQPSSPFQFQTPSLCYFLPFSLMMPAVCLMLLLDELLTKIIIHSIEDEPIFHFLNL